MNKIKNNILRSEKTKRRKLVLCMTAFIFIMKFTSDMSKDIELGHFNMVL